MGDSEGSEQTKTCPRCAEHIKAEALVCHFCRQEFTVRHLGYCTTCHEQVDVGAGTTCPTCGKAVMDATTESEPVASPLTRPAPTAAGVAPAGIHVRHGTVAGRRQTVVFTVLQALLGLALGFYAVATFLVVFVLRDWQDPVSPPPRLLLQILTWKFDLTESGLAWEVGYAYPPLLIFLTLVVRLFACSWIDRKPTLRRGFIWKAGRLNRAALRNFRSQCHRLGFAGLQNPSWIRRKIGVGVAASLVLAGTGIGHLAGGDAEYANGVGPYLAVAVGLAGTLGFALLWPTRDAPSFVVDQDGTLWTASAAPMGPPLLSSSPPAATVPVPRRPGPLEGQAAMGSDRVARQVEKFLEEAEASVAALDWVRAKELAEAALLLAPDNSDARSFLRAADHALTKGSGDEPP